MTVKNPYEPPTYGVRNLAIERRIAGKPPTSVEEEEKAEPEPANKADAEPKNKAARKPANKGKK